MCYHRNIEGIFILRNIPEHIKEALSALVPVRHVLLTLQARVRISANSVPSVAALLNIAQRGMVRPLEWLDLLALRSCRWVDQLNG